MEAWSKDTTKKEENQEKKETGYQVYVELFLSLKDLYQVKGLSLVPINWDTLKPRKQKMEAWSKDTTKKEKD